MRDRAQVNLRWLYKLRWAAIFGHLATIAFVTFVLRIELPWRNMLTIVGLLAASNVVVGYALTFRAAQSAQFLHSHSEWPIGSIMLLDNLLLMALLYCSGGPLNPFTILFLVNVSLAGVLLNAWWAWLLGMLALLSFSALFVSYVPLPALEHGMSSQHAKSAHDHADRDSTSAIAADNPPHLHLHLRGMLFAFGAATIFITYFTTRVTKELSELESQLSEARQREAQGEKLDALATLAAGAAHELSTPLSTVAVLARELEITLTQAGGHSEGVSDARVIREEVDRCRHILHEMCSAAGEAAGEEIVSVTMHELIHAVVTSIGDPERISIHIDPTLSATSLRFPKVALAQAIRAIVRNGIDATRDNRLVDISASTQQADVMIRVTDHGIGMPRNVLRRAGEPFFTTKEAGNGMGLGLYLARRVIERLGGRLTIDSTDGSGTTVDIHLPVLLGERLASDLDTSANTGCSSPTETKQ